MAFERRLGHDPYWTRELGPLPDLRRLGREARRRTSELLDRMTPAVARAIAVTELAVRGTWGRVRTMNVPAQILERIPRLPARRTAPPPVPAEVAGAPAVIAPGVESADAPVVVQTPVGTAVVAEPVVQPRPVAPGTVVSGRTWATSLPERALNWIIAIACLALLIVGLRTAIALTADVVEFIQETVNTFFQRFDYPTPL